MQNLFPQVKPKKFAQNERREFANLTDLMQYIIDLDAEEKRKKQSLKSSLRPGVTENWKVTWCQERIPPLLKDENYWGFFFLLVGGGGVN